jgi:hypothetical protein
MDLQLISDIFIISGFFIALVAAAIKIMVEEQEIMHRDMQDFFEDMELEEARRDEECRRIKLSQQGIDEDLHNIPLI